MLPSLPSRYWSSQCPAAVSDFRRSFRHLVSPLATSLGLSALGLSALGCSLLQEFGADQCTNTEDCLALGNEFAGTICESNICVTSTGGDGGTGGGTDGGTGGGPEAPECVTNKDCIDSHVGSPYICRDGSCLSLVTSPECPIVLGAGQDNENLEKPDPIIFGVYSYVDPTAPRLSVPTLNYELAIDEVNEATRGGVPGGSGGTLRPFIAVVCSGTNDPDLDKSLGHLIDDLQVPAVVSSLYTKELLEAFETKAHPKQVFFLSPLVADSTLTQQDDDGLLWHILPSALDISPAYVPLLVQVEAYIRKQQAFAADTPLKVAMVEAKTPFLSDIAEDLIETTIFNGKSVIKNENDGNFLRLRVDSELETPNPDLSAALTALQAFEPDVVLAMTGGEFVPTMAKLEATWNPEASGPRPFYLTSSYMFNREDLSLASLSSARTRLLGVNFAAAADTTLYDLYVSKLKSTYDVDFSLEGAENFYDAAYYLMYSIVGAGTPPRLTGKEVALGMTRLLSGKTKFNVGSKDVNSIIGNLRGSPDSFISLQGTMGPPDFNTSTGARRGAPSVYCIDSDGNYLQNVMIYDAVEKTLSGSPACISDFSN